MSLGERARSHGFGHGGLAWNESCLEVKQPTKAPEEMAMGKRAQGMTRGRARSVARDLKPETTSVRGGAAAVSELSVIVYNGHAGLGANVRGVAVDAGADAPGGR